MIMAQRRLFSLPLWAAIILQSRTASAIECYTPSGKTVSVDGATCDPPLLTSKPSPPRLSKGAIIGITIASIIGLLLVVALVAFLIHRSRTRSSQYPPGPSSRLSVASLLPSRHKEKPRKPSRTFSANSLGIFFVPAPIQRRSTGWGYDFPKADEQDEQKLEECPALPPPPSTPSPPPPTTSSTWPTLPGTSAGSVVRSWSTRVTSGWALRFPSVRQSRHERLRMMDGEEGEIMDAFAVGEKRAETWG